MPSKGFTKQPKSVLKRWKRVREQNNADDQYWAEVDARNKKKKLEMQNKSSSIKESIGSAVAAEGPGEHDAVGETETAETVPEQSESTEAAVRATPEEKAAQKESEPVARRVIKPPIPQPCQKKKKKKKKRPEQ